jgi:hypothetical protein
MQEKEVVETKIVETKKDEITQEQIAQWKKQYGEDNIYKAVINDNTYIYKCLFRAEFKSIAKQGSNIMNPVDSNIFMEEQNVILGTIYPKITANNIDVYPAGTISRLSELIMEASGFDEQAEGERL